MHQGLLWHQACEPLLWSGLSVQKRPQPLWARRGSSWRVSVEFFRRIALIHAWGIGRHQLRQMFVLLLLADKYYSDGDQWKIFLGCWSWSVSLEKENHCNFTTNLSSFTHRVSWSTLPQARTDLRIGHGLGPRATLSYDDSILTKNLRNCAEA